VTPAPLGIERNFRYRNNLPFDGFVHAEASIMGDSKNHEWTLLKEQFELLVRAKGVRANDVEELLDIEFQRRLADLIEEALKRRRGVGH
jgi:hypothetical protein